MRARHIAAVAIGNALEFYDFLIYGFFAVYIGQAFFPNRSVTVVGVLVDASFFVLRKREPALARPFRARLYPWLPGLLLVIDAALLVLFSREDKTGILVAFGLAAACVPFAWLARRANFRLRSAGM